MWYNFDLHRFAYEMLPPLLRGKVMLALLRAFLQPLVWLLAQFQALRSESKERLSSSGQSLALVEVIRRAYNLPEGDVFITDREKRQIYLYKLSEMQKPLYLFPLEVGDSSPHYLGYEDEGSVLPDFYLHLPDYLEGEAESILRLIEQYKPAGRTYQIIYYPYE